MELCERMGDRGVALLQSRFLHPVIYQMAELGEAAFGPSLIQHLSEDLPHTANGLIRNHEILEPLTDRFFRRHLIPGLQRTSPDFPDLPPLSSATYVDYFVKISDIQRQSRGTPEESASQHVSDILMAYSTESSHPLISGIVDFFRLSRNQSGYEDLMIEACRIAKGSVQGPHG